MAGRCWFVEEFDLVLLEVFGGIEGPTVEVVVDEVGLREPDSC